MVGRGWIRFGWVLITVVLSTLGVTQVGQAQSGEQIRAKQLFDAALELMDRSAYSTACPMLEESLSLDPGMGTKYYLASCYEKTGRLASAYRLLQEVAASAKASGKRDRERHARKAARKLVPRLPKLSVVVPAELAASEGLRVTRDRRPLARSQWGRPTAIDLGEHEIMARQKGSSTAWRRKVWITREGQTVTVEIPALDSLKPSDKPKAEPTKTETPSNEPESGPSWAEGTAPPPPRPEPTGEVDGMLLGGIASIAVAVGAAAVFGWAFAEVTSIAGDEDMARYREGFTAEDDICELAAEGRVSSAIGSPPPSDVADMCDTASDLEIVQGIMLPTAVGLTTLGVVLIVLSDTAQGDDSPDDDVDVAVHLGPSAGSVQLRLRF